MLQLIDKMNNYPFGRFMISGGVAMFLGYLFALLLFEDVAKRYGEKVAILAMMVLSVIVILLITDFNRKYSARVTVPIGIAGWIGVYILGYIYLVLPY